MFLLTLRPVGRFTSGKNVPGAAKKLCAKFARFCHFWKFAGSGGIDTVRSYITFNLGATAQVKGALENVALQGTGNINAFGNSLNNALTGNSGNNLLAVGNGNDVLTGGAGNDIFYLNAALNGSTNVDTITDMNQAGNDTIRLENAIFTTLAAGALSAGAFRLGAAAADADDRIIYNNANGQLFYDSNGNAAGGSTLIAILDNGLLLATSDFQVV
jgi:serralysin